jgi:hypothetical protein
MPFVSQRPKLKLTEEDRTWLQRVSRSRSEAAGRVQRPKFCCAITGARRFRRSLLIPSTASRALALERGVRSALQDLPGGADGRRWALKPGLGWWRWLARSPRSWVRRRTCGLPGGWPSIVRKHGVAAGHSSLQQLGRGTVSKILRARAIQLHKIRYDLEQRDPVFETKMKQVLHVCPARVPASGDLAPRGGAPSELTAVLPDDEKPGIQAWENKAPDRPPVPGERASVGGRS